jgi:hypothetical protein
MEKYLIYQTYAGAQNKINSINQSCIGYKWTDGITINYSEIVFGKDFFAVPILDDYEEFFTPTQIGAAKYLTTNEDNEFIIQ